MCEHRPPCSQSPAPVSTPAVHASTPPIPSLPPCQPQPTGRPQSTGRPWSAFRRPGKSTHGRAFPPKMQHARAPRCVHEDVPLHRTGNAPHVPLQGTGSVSAIAGPTVKPSDRMRQAHCADKEEPSRWEEKRRGTEHRSRGRVCVTKCAATGGCSYKHR